MSRLLWVAVLLALLQTGSAVQVGEVVAMEKWRAYVCRRELCTRDPADPCSVF